MLVTLVFALLGDSPTVAQELIVDVDAVRSLVVKWNEAHEVNSVEMLSLLYSDEVNFYGSKFTRSKCIARKKTMLKDQPSFSQKIKGGLHLTGYEGGVIRCDFVKAVTRNYNALDYESYLIIKSVGENYFIVGESDLITDRNIRNKPDLGKQVAIKKGEYDVISQTFRKTEEPADTDKPSLTRIILITVLTGIGVVGVFTIFRRRKKLHVPRRNQSAANDVRFSVYSAKQFDKGMDFEKFIVERFGLNKNHFHLLEWRSDKFHQGIYPKSNQNPDLVYEFKLNNFVRKFSVECKYRGIPINGSVYLMDDNNYRNYAAYHMNEMPVYIVLGLRGNPSSPKELFLIPFQEAKPEMTYDELSKYRTTKNYFFYHMLDDRLT